MDASVEPNEESTGRNGQPLGWKQALHLVRTLPEDEAIEFLRQNWPLLLPKDPGIGLVAAYCRLLPHHQNQPPRPPKPEEDDLPVILKMRKEGSGSPYWNEVRTTVTDEKWKSYLFWGKAKGWFPQDAA